MKMVKKILLGLTAAAAVISFVSCSGIANDNAEEEGKKDDKTITLNATSSDEDYVANKKYKRAFVQLGTLEQVQEATSTITFSKADVANGVVGYAFDLNYDKDENDKDLKTINFVLIGFNPSLNKYYVERYKEVDLEANNGYTDASSLGKYISYNGSSWESTYSDKDRDDFIDAKEGKHYSIDTDGNISIKFTISQATDLKYEVKMGTEKVCEYTRTDKSAKDDTKYVNVTKNGKAQGGIALYANAKNGLNFKVNCKTEVTKGKFEAEEID